MVQQPMTSFMFWNFLVSIFGPVTGCTLSGSSVPSRQLNDVYNDADYYDVQLMLNIKQTRM